VDCGIMPVSTETRHGMTIWTISAKQSAFLKQTALTVSLPDFLNSGGDSIHDASGPFHHLGCFFVFNRFGEGV
jgi:hypothetical protein